MQQARSDWQSLDSAVSDMRRQLEPSFQPDTSAPGFPTNTPSGGHCAAAAAIVHVVLGGKLVSARVAGTSHWFNRITAGGVQYDVDLTADQFGFAPYLVAPANELYSGTRERDWSQLNAETLARAELLAERAGFESIKRTIRRALAKYERS